MKRGNFLVAGATSVVAVGAAPAAVAVAPAAAAPAAVVAAPASAAGTILDEAAFRARIATGTGVRHRQAIGAARVNDGAAYQFAVNTLNGFATGWNEPAGSAQIAVVLFGSAAVLGLDDAAWHDHKLADLVRTFKGDWLTPDAAQGNPWSHASTTLAPTADKSIPALLKRGVMVFICNTALGEISNRIVAAGNANGVGDAFAVQASLRKHAVPGTDIVPAGISSVSVLQESGYTYFSAAL
jgi:intracellular sulfur oxidation DsrE/DsrF family protein